MNKSVFLVIVLLVLFPSNQVQAQAGSSKTQPPERNLEAQSLYEDGMKRLEMGQVSEALERFQRALKIDSEYAEAYSGLGRALFKLGQWENSIGPFRRAIALKAKERERRDALQKNRQREQPQLNVVIQPRKLNKPLPAPRINTKQTIESVLAPPPAAEAVPQANINVEILQAEQPPEPAGVPIAMNDKPLVPPVEVTSIPAAPRNLPANEIAVTKIDELIEAP